MRIEGNIRQIYIYAFGKQYEEIDQNIRKGRKLQSKHINTSTEVKVRKADPFGLTLFRFGFRHFYYYSCY
jgi:hypothetical protein